MVTFVAFLTAASNLATSRTATVNAHILPSRFVGFFQECTRLWTAGGWLARRLHQFKASTTMDLGISIFLISVQNVWP